MAVLSSGRDQGGLLKKVAFQCSEEIMFSVDLLVEVVEVQPRAYELIWQAVDNIES